MIEDLIQRIKEKNPKRVLIQIPEGLKTRAKEIEGLLNEEGIECIVSLDPCYGACDLRDHEAKRLGCNLLVHVGHSDFGLKTEIPVLYYEWKIEFDPSSVLKENLDKLENFKNIGLVSTINYLDSLETAKEFLESHGKSCLIGGQILGCNVMNAKKIEKEVDVFLYIGSGKFHPVGLALETDKPVYMLDVERKIIEKVDVELFLKQRYVAQELARRSNSFGILVSTKPGQMRIKTAIEIKKKITSMGKEAYIFSMDEITPEKLLGIDVDCYINTACPRIAIDNRTTFGKPILNPDEVNEILNK
ncbi:MAG: diphthamide biosynthesis enzyme Dph2 [Candidatus Aenigmarchaeota archaeon]|nr:diphthamide biosynthesis enzyme Dph2 [Candidatus Aenigmarchaeota archaeon]